MIFELYLKEVRLGIVKYAKSIAEFFETNERWRQELMLLRDILLSTGLKEGLKWGAPVYMIDGKNIVGIGAFKSYFGLWYYQGGLLSDPEKVLFNAQEGVTKALRQWRFSSIDEVDPELILAYTREAIQNQKDGKQIKPEKKPMPEKPEIMLELFDKDPLLKEQFYKQTPFRQREFIEHITDAKKEETRVRRLNKIALLLRQGAGLNDKYR
jgi:uncharacterized protein YdeI (YjbR/CyaY-like superfamily)